MQISYVWAQLKGEFGLTDKDQLMKVYSRAKRNWYTSGLTLIIFFPARDGKITVLAQTSFH